MKSLLLGIVLLLSAACAFAQSEVPTYEAYLGYSFTRVNSGINVPAFSANGGLGEVGLNFNRWFSAIGSFNAVHNGNIGGFHVDQTLFGYNFGPRIHVRMGRIDPFFETLFGATHDSRSFALPGTATVVGSNGEVIKARFVNDATAFSMLAGGGLDLNLNKNVAFRPIKLDYYLTRFQPVFINGLGDENRNRNQSNLLYSTGFLFRF